MKYLISVSASPHFMGILNDIAPEIALCIALKRLGQYNQIEPS